MVSYPGWVGGGIHSYLGWVFSPWAKSDKKGITIQDQKYVIPIICRG